MKSQTLALILIITNSFWFAISCNSSATTEAFIETKRDTTFDTTFIDRLRIDTFTDTFIQIDTVIDTLECKCDDDDPRYKDKDTSLAWLTNVG